MPPKKKTEAEAAAAAPAAEAAPKEPKAKKEKAAKEAKEAKELTEPTRRSTRIKDLPPKPDAGSLAPAPTRKKRRGDNKNDPDNLEYKPGGASGRKGGKKRKKASVKDDDDDDADEEEKPKKKLKSEVSTHPLGYCLEHVVARNARLESLEIIIPAVGYLQVLLGKALRAHPRLGRVRRLLHPLRPKRRVSSREQPHKIKHGSLTVFIAFLSATGKGGRRQRRQGRLAAQGVGQGFHHRRVCASGPHSQERKG